VPAVTDSASRRDFRPPLLVLRALGLGDLLTGVPALRALRRAYPDYRAVLACPSWLHPLARITGALDDVIDVSGLTPFRLRLPPALAVNLHGRGPRSHRVLLAQRPVSFLAFAHPDITESAGMPQWRRDEHEVARWCRLLDARGIVCDCDDLELDNSRVWTPTSAGVAGATVVHAGAGSTSRRWPADRFAAVVAAERVRGRRVVLTGGPGDEARCEYIAQRACLPDECVLAGRTSVLELAAVVAGAARVVSGDTGVAHLATAFRRPSVVLFGPVSPREWGPPPTRSYHRALWTGRRGDPHGTTTDPGLLEISVADVVDALEALPCGDERVSAPSASFKQEVAR
jgi:Glycosyltransferase family 9 (heptosyltransferase)